MDELEQEYPLMHPEYSPILTFLYQNLPFVSIAVGTACNTYAVSRLRNTVDFPLRGLAMLWCSCNAVSILIVESLFAYEMHAGGWYLGDLLCRLNKSFAVLPVCANPWFLVAAVVSFSDLVPLRGVVTWLVAALLGTPIAYTFYSYGHIETYYEDEYNATAVGNCMHVLTRDEFYWTNILSYIVYYNTPVVAVMCFLLFSYNIQQNKTSEWSYCFRMLSLLSLAQLVCWLPHWLGLFYMIKANDEYSGTVLVFLIVEVLVSVHIGVIVPRGLTKLALHYVQYAVHENLVEPPNVEMHGVDSSNPARDWP